MSTAGAAGHRSEPARHERPEIDEAALIAALAVDRVLVEARTRGAKRWETFLAPLPDRLRDDDLRDLRGSALRTRAAYGPRDSIRDALPPDVTEPLLEALDRLLRLLARREAAGGI